MLAIVPVAAAGWGAKTLVTLALSYAGFAAIEKTIDVVSGTSGDLEAEAQLSVDREGQRTKQDFINAKVTEQRREEGLDREVAGVTRAIHGGMMNDPIASGGPAGDHSEFMTGLTQRLGMSVDELRRRTDPSRVGEYGELAAGVRRSQNG